MEGSNRSLALARYIVNRIFQLLGIVLGVVAVIFVFARLASDPVLIMLEQDYSSQQYEAMRQHLGLDRPLHVQLTLYFMRLAGGDLGRSLVSQEPVLDQIMARLPATAALAGAAMLVALAISIPAGIVSAVRPYSKIDNASMLACLFGVSVPTFWAGIMLTLLFSYYLDWLPAFGRGDPPDLAHLVLPAITLGMHVTATTARLTRSCLLEIINEDYIQTARAKGLREFVIINKHALRNAMLPVVTDIGLTLTRLMSGLTVIEVVFAWPGIGKLSYDAVVQSDYPMIQGTVLFVAVLFVAVNLIIDLLYCVLDPRIRYA